jgi:hypothetical protein
MPKRGYKFEVDGLTKDQRYRQKDLEAYRKLKREYARTPEERKKRREYMRVWREANREHHNELARQSHARNKHKHVDRNRNYHLVATFGITLERKHEMMAAQDGKCLICIRPFTLTGGGRPHVDHCHATDVIRGILCNICNTKLGWFEQFGDSVLNYLKRSK